jgi:ribosomal protein S18 acetylase RimI-like enzyme
MRGGRLRGAVSLPRRRTPASNVARAAFGEIERARGQDYASAAEVFVEAFFLRKGGAADVITKSELAYLNGAQKRDMVGRYNKRGLCAMYVIRDDDTGKVVGCVGADVQTFKGTVPVKRATDATKGEVADRPVIANLATAPAARRRGLAKKLMARIEEECKEWGFEEAVLVVEANNSKARSLYSKLGYKAIGGEPDTPNIVIDRETGKVVNGAVKTVFMRKSLKEGAGGVLENIDVTKLVGVGAAVAAAAKFALGSQ